MCSRAYYDKLSSLRTKPTLDTQQKFMTSIVDGLSSQANVQVDCISVVPISRTNFPKTCYRGHKEKINGVSYEYVGFLNIPIMKNMSAAHAMKNAVKRYYKKHKKDDIKVLADSLTIEVSLSALWLQKKGIQITAIVTDIPLIAETMGSSGGFHGLYSKLYGKMANFLLLKYDKYVLLSEYMNEIVNPEKKQPYMIMECIVDENLFNGIENKVGKEKGRPSVMYAGKFYRECGILELAKASSALKDVCDIWLYGGHGDCDEELERLAKENSNLKLHGILPLKEILQLEKDCTLLINPRSGEEEFSKYSFPSKTAEYMMSGTPVLMYKLPSLPDDYLPYVYLIENTDLAETISNILKKEKNVLETKGRESCSFIIKKKNKMYQTKRIIDFLSK